METCFGRSLETLIFPGIFGTARSLYFFPGTQNRSETARPSRYITSRDIVPSTLIQKRTFNTTPLEQDRVWINNPLNIRDISINIWFVTVIDRPSITCTTKWVTMRRRNSLQYQHKWRLASTVQIKWHSVAIYCSICTYKLNVWK